MTWSAVWIQVRQEQPAQQGQGILDPKDRKDPRVRVHPRARQARQAHEDTQGKQEPQVMMGLQDRPDRWALSFRRETQGHRGSRVRIQQREPRELPDPRVQRDR
jgi:hypothetical protein